MPLILLLPPLVGWALALRPVSARWLARFGRRFAVPIDTATGPVITSAVRTSRRWRAIGGSLGWGAALVVPGLVLAAVDPDGDTRSLVTFATLLAGWFVGTLAGELAQWRRPAGVATAGLRPRRADDYVPRWPILLGRVEAVTALVALPVGLAVVTDPEVADGWRVLAVTGTVVAVSGVAAATVALRAIADRPQDASAGAPLVRADDGLRALAAHRIAGTALALTTYGTLVVVGQPAFELTPWLMTPIMVIALLLLGSARGLSHDVGWDLPEPASR